MRLSREMIASILDSVADEVRDCKGDPRAFAIAAFERRCQRMIDIDKRLKALERARIKSELNRVFDPVTRFYVDVP